MNHIQHQFKIDARPEKVFDAIATPTGLNSWWSLESDGKPELNEIYRFFFGPDYDWRAQVIHVVPGKELTWQMTEAMDDWLPTQVVFKLLPAEDGCTISFSHANWPDAGEHFAATNYCWGQLLRGLKEFVEQGKIVPFEQRA